MILFQPEHVAPIISGRKTQTRRGGKRRWRVGAEHQCKTQLFGEPFAIVRILEVHSEYLGDISLDDARAEGYDSRTAFRYVWEDIHGVWDPGLTVWVVEFELVAASEDKSRGAR